MRKAIGAVPLAITLAACGGAGATDTASSRPETRAGGAGCVPHGARVLARDSVAAVYRTGAGAFGCVSGSRRRTKVGDSGKRPGQATVQVATIRGTRAGLAVEQGFVDGSSATVEEIELRSGRRLAGGAATDRGLVESVQTVTRIVLGARDSIAWSASDRSIINRGQIKEVRVATPRGTRTLASGAGIALASLRLSGGRFVWREGAATRSAPAS